MTKPKLITTLADAVLGYVLHEEYANFADWFSDDGWDDGAACRALGLKDISEEQAQAVVQQVYMHNQELIEALAYNLKPEEHLYADALKLAVILGLEKAPKLTKVQKKFILADAHE